MERPYSPNKPISPSNQKMAGTNKHGNMFPTPKWQDVWAAILFYLHFAAFVGISVYAFMNLNTIKGAPNQGTDPTIPEIDRSMITMFTICGATMAIVSLGLTMLTISAMYRNPESMLHFCFLANIVVSGLAAIYFFVAHAMWVGVACGLGALIGILFYVMFRSRIPFSAIILKTVIDGLRTYPTMLVVTSSSVAITIVYLIYWGSTVSALGVLVNHGGYDKSVWMIIYSAFSLFWSSQVLTNVVQTTVAGVYATFYFLHGTGQTIVRPVASSLGRAMTHSFGSICFGSLIVAVIQTLRFLVQMFRDPNSISGCIADCILGCIQGLVEYFNYYAYTQIAIYGKSYVQAAKDTWSLVTTRGVDAIVNDNLIGSCTGLASLAIGIVSGGLVFVIAKVIYGRDWQMALMTALLMGLLGLIIPMVAFEILNAGATTTFVCLAEDPAALQRTKPELYNAIMQRYSMINL